MERQVWSTFTDLKEHDMHSNLDNGPVLTKTRELCETIINQTDFLAMRRDVETFLADDDARSRYHSLANKGQDLQYKQQQGAQLTREEIEAFEQERETIMQMV